MKEMKTYFLMAMAVLFAVFLFGCNKQSGGPAVTLSADGASPGMIVRVTTAQPVFSDATAARIEIGGKLAPIVKVVSATEADVLVPNAAAGESQLKITGGKIRGAAPFTVLPASAQELVLRWKDNRFELMAVHPTADEPNMVTRSDEPQLSYDLVNAQGGLVLTGAINHPALARMELFDGPNAREAVLRREPRHPGKPVVFTLKVPIVPQGASVKFYESEPGVNLMDAAARQSRRPVGEIKLEK
jgi:hypothetical protein